MKPYKSEIFREYEGSLFILKSTAVEWPDNFWIITACDPYSAGDRTSDDRAMKQLRQELSRKKCWKNRITGISPDWKHREASFAVGGLEADEALETGRRYGQNAVFCVQGDRLSLIACGDRQTVEMGNFRQRLRLDSDEPKYRIYVVLLESGVAEKKRFIKANPNYQIGKPCYYVGMTGKTPDERLAQHKSGHKACSYVTNYGIRLELEKFESIPLLNHADAVAMEVSHAELLRSQGYGVWQK
jgi:predicted GIY-YIG superfamily endonuclease